MAQVFTFLNLLLTEMLTKRGQVSKKMPLQQGLGFLHVTTVSNVLLRKKNVL